jgi:hypothetical protein
MSTDPLPLGAMQGRVEQMPLSLQAHASEMIEDCLPRGEIARQVAAGSGR